MSDRPSPGSPGPSAGSAAERWPFGDPLEGYEVLDRLGEGGMGAVYRLRQERTGELRVAKVMHRALAVDARFAARFEREARLLERLDHPHVARLHEVMRTAEGDAVLVMEYVEGVDLASLRRRLGTLPPSAVLALGRQVAEALDALHRQGWVHRDLSPDNLLVRRAEGGAGQPEAVLIDLGIAKALASSATTELHGAQRTPLTTEGGFIGKVRYSSPEQLSGTADLDGRSDLYALGVVLYELLTGRCPIEGSGPDSWIAGHLMRPPLPFREADAQVPEALQQLIMGLLAKDPNRRPRDARALAAELEQLAAEHPLAAAEAASLGEAIADGIRDRRPVEAEDAPTLTRPRAAAGSTESVRSPRSGGKGPVLARPWLWVPIGLGLALLVALWIGGPWTPDPMPTPESAAERVATGPTVEEGAADGIDSQSEPSPSVDTPDEESAAGVSADREAELPPSTLGAESTIERESPRLAPEAAPIFETDGMLVSPRPGRLELDATPWAELVAVFDADGESVAPVFVGAGSGADFPISTPLAMDLLPGTYGLVLRHGAPGSGREPEIELEVEIEIMEAGIHRHHVEMDEVNIDAFFRGLGWP